MKALLMNVAIDKCVYEYICSIESSIDLFLYFRVWKDNILLFSCFSCIHLFLTPFGVFLTEILE